MKRVLLLLTLCLLAGSLARAEDLPRLSPTPATNAATVYWQAFAALPTLSLEEQQSFDAVRNKNAEPIPADVEPLIERFAAALGIMYRASEAKACDWDLNYSDGPMLTLPHLAKLRQLNAAALMRARSRFAANDIGGAMNDILAMLRMARHAGKSPVIVSVLVGASIETSATDLLGSQLPKLDRPALNRLAKELAALPAPISIADCLQEEGSSFARYLEAFSQDGSTALVGAKLVKKLRNTGFLSDINEETARGFDDSLATVESLHTSLARLRRDYAEMAQIAGLRSYTQREEQAKKFEADLSAARAQPQPLEPAHCFRCGWSLRWAGWSKVKWSGAHGENCCNLPCRCNWTGLKASRPQRSCPVARRSIRPSIRATNCVIDRRR